MIRAASSWTLQIIRKREGVDTLTLLLILAFALVWC